MQANTFPRWQFAFVSVFMLADALYLPATSTALALALVIAGFSAALLTYLLCRLLRNTDVLALSGLWGRVFAGILALLSARFALREMLRLCTFWQQTAFHTLPWLLMLLLVLAAGLHLARTGTMHLAMWSLPTLIVILIPLTLAIVLTAPDWQMQELSMPRATSDFFYLVFDCFLRYFLPVTFPLLLLSRQTHCVAASAGVCFSGIVLAITAAHNVLLLGAHAAAQVVYPTFAAAGLVTLGEFFQRAEVLVSSCLSICQLARLAMLFLLMARTLRTAFALPDKIRTPSCSS